MVEPVEGSRALLDPLLTDLLKDLTSSSLNVRRNLIHKKLIPSLSECKGTRGPYHRHVPAFANIKCATLDQLHEADYLCLLECLLGGLGRYQDLDSRRLMEEALSFIMNHCDASVLVELVGKMESLGRTLLPKGPEG